MKKLVWMAICSIFFVRLAASQQASPPPAQPAPIAVEPWVLHSKLTKEVDPQYRWEAREHKIEGDVTIDVVVDQDGNVASTRWVRTEGTSTALAYEALDAVNQWKYQPTLVDGKPVPVASWVLIRFRLEPQPNVEIVTRFRRSTPATKPEELKGPLRLRISPGVASGNLIHQVDPGYPLAAKIGNIQGDVVLQIVIGKDGAVIYIQPVSGPAELINAAVDAVRQWKYVPYYLNGEPIEVETPITVRFRLGNQRG